MSGRKSQSPQLLPDYPKIKEVIREKLFERVALRSVVMPIRRVPIREGDRVEVVRADGTCEEIKLKAHEAMLEISYDDLASDSIDAVIDRVDAMGDELGSQVTDTIMATFQETTERTGNVVDNRGSRLTPEKIMEMIEKIQMDFDEHGNPTPLHIVGSGAALEQYRNCMMQTDNDPTLRQRAQALMNKKRDEYIDRESRRKLVD